MAMVRHRKVEMELCKNCGLYAGTHACDKKDVKILRLTKAVAANQAHINRLNSWIKEEGLRSNICTKNILRKICDNCQCGKAA